MLWQDLFKKSFTFCRLVSGILDSVHYNGVIDIIFERKYRFFVLKADFNALNSVERFECLLNMSCAVVAHHTFDINCLFHSCFLRIFYILFCRHELRELDRRF